MPLLDDTEDFWKVVRPVRLPPRPPEESKIEKRATRAGVVVERFQAGLIGTEDLEAKAVICIYVAMKLLKDPSEEDLINQGVSFMYLPWTELQETYARLRLTSN